jgi:hypothetical protein
MARWGWPIMGLLAAAPILGHALDWRSRALAKQKLKDERALKARQQLEATRDIAPLGADAYKAAAYARKLAQARDRSPVDKLNVLDKAIKAARK